ncbi:variable large family protein (plasmid) [Borrelia coriaceae]|uniref:Variable large protein n=1 Tax=Borrelia coriaceae ATCC 43381 TaxID=1408429 RepID=W5T1U1_9SPIR|nr:variable large family protein [Borrelia coriaceae]AHH11246.1 Variable major outer membrane lipoprotein [Borrelia coriaceae ATCC 43381]UPA17442.1 variable large family protein [Borrelia coriaceae]
MKINIKNIKVRSICATLFISLFLSCNNGIVEELEKEKTFLSSLMDVGRSAENTYYSFMELVSDVLGFNVTKETTGTKVKEYFTGLASGIEKAIQELVKIKNNTEEFAKEETESAFNKTIEGFKDTLTTLKGYVESLKDIGDANQKVGEVGGSQNGAAADTEELKKALKALKGIVDIAKTQKVEEPKKNDVAISDANLVANTPKDGARALVTGKNAGASAGPGAAAIVSAVSGEAILAAIVAAQEDDASTGVPGGTASANTSAVAFAKGGTDQTNIANVAAKASAVAGGIALRSLVKTGKLAANDANNDKATVQAAGVAAVNKLLVALEDIIIKTVKKVLEKAKEKIDKSRDSQQNPVSQPSR